MRRAAPALAWTLFVITVVAALGWGAHAPNSWDVDNIAPGSVLRALAARFGPGWFSSYGPVPYLLVGTVYVPLLLFFRLTGELGVPVPEYPWGFAHPDVSIGALVLAARLVSVALACGVAWIVTRERWTSSSRDAWLPPLLLAGSPTFVYYARTSNVDVYSLFFLTLAFGCALRATGLRMRIAAGAAAALAVCCKEQAAPYAAIAALAAGWGAGGTEGRRSDRLRGMLVVGAAAVAAYAIAWALPFHLPGWRAHHRFLFEQARYPREFPMTPAGISGLTTRTIRLLPVTIGWPILAGVALAVLRRDAWRGLGWRVAAQALYAAGFLGVIGYVYPRFLLPAMLLLLPLALRGWSFAFHHAGRRAPAVAAFVVGLVLLGGPVLDAAQLRDTRYRAREWLGRHRAALAIPASPVAPTIELVGNPRFLMQVPPGYAPRGTNADSLRRFPRPPEADVVVLSSFDAYEVRSDTLLRRLWWDGLHDPRGAYRLGADVPPPRWARLAAGLPISPVIWIWVRRDARGAGSP